MLLKFDFSTFINVQTMVTALLVALFLWIIRSLYNYYFKTTPKLYIHTGKPLWSQYNIHNTNFEFRWRNTIKIMNKSRHSCYIVYIRNPKGWIINDTAPLETLIEKQHFLDANKEMSIEICKVVTKPFDTVMNVTYEGNVRVVNGAKAIDRDKDLKPKEVDKIKLYVKYKNENGRIYYSKYTKTGIKEQYKIQLIRPFLLNDLIYGMKNLLN